MADGVVFLGNRREDTMQNQLSNSSRNTVPLRRADSGSSSKAALTPGEEEEEEEEEEVRNEEPPTTWPLESRHILVRTRDGQPPKSLPLRIERVAEPGSFKRVWSLAAVENVYDLGFWDNLVEVLTN